MRSEVIMTSAQSANSRYSQLNNSDSTYTDTASIPSNYARIIGRELALNIRDIPKLLQFTSLTTKQFMQEETRLTAQQQIQVLHNGLYLSKHLDFGLRLGQRLTPSTHGAMGFLVNSSPNLLIALQAFQAFLPTRISFARLQLQIEADTVLCLVQFDIALSPTVHRVLSETCAVIFYECAEFIVGRPVTEASIYFSHAKPSYSQCYADYLPGAYAFAANDLRVKIPLSMCEIPNASANQEGYLLAMRQCELMLAQLNPQTHNDLYQIQRIMLSQPLSELNEASVAAALFVSKRTLARKIKQHKLSFRELRDHILSTQASSYLRDSELSVDAIASLLNYHDSANFRRAFKRWFGMTPSDYRREQSASLNTGERIKKT